MNKVKHLALAGSLIFGAAMSAQAADLQLVLGTGFDDTTAIAPEGGNPGTTVGDQRLIVYEFAADLWGGVLESDVPVLVFAQFAPLTCTATGAVLGQAGAQFVFSDFAPGIVPGTWYGSALADSIAGVDLVGGPATPGNADIFSQFNANIQSNPGCLGGARWYYGLDGNAPAGTFDFLNVVMHEIGHGLGFQNFANEATGAFFLDTPDIYSVFSFDNTLGLNWPDMTNAERAFSSTNTGNLVWDGASVTASAPLVLDNRAFLDFSDGIGLVEPQQASYGPAPTAANFGGEVVLADDGGGPGTATDGCEAITNDVAGKIALIDRGACAFVTKSLNAQAAGASGVIVANNAPGGPAPMGGTSNAVNIPSVGIDLATGDAIKAALPGVTVSFFIDPSLLQGADDNGLVRLYAPGVVALGSSVSHYDTALSPNALMEPFISGDLSASFNVDLTPSLYEDIGWVLDDGNGEIEGCDTTVDAVNDMGIILGARIEAISSLCASQAGNPGNYQSCLSAFTNEMKSAGLISGRQKGRTQSCGGNSGLPN